MKLDAEDSIALHRRGERTAVIGARNLVRRIRSSMKLDEVEHAVLDAFEKRSASALGALNTIPSNLRNGKRALEFVYFTPHQSESGHRSHLVRNIEEKLVSDTDAEQRCAVCNGSANRAVDAVLLQPAHRSDERADAGKDEFLRARDRVGIARNLQVSADRAESTRDVRDVRHR